MEQIHAQSHGEQEQIADLIVMPVTHSEPTEPAEPPMPPPEIEQDLLRSTEKSETETSETAKSKDSNTRQLVPILTGVAKRLGLSKQGWKLELLRTGHMSNFDISNGNTVKSAASNIDKIRMQENVLREMGAHALSIVNPFRKRARVIDTTGIKML